MGLRKRVERIMRVSGAAAPICAGLEARVTRQNPKHRPRQICSAATSPRLHNRKWWPI
jgi:hypothetical protein